MNKQWLVRLVLISLTVLLAGCAPSNSPVTLEVVSVASRGVSLGATVDVPEPVVLPAGIEAEVRENAEPEVTITGDCTTSGNLQLEAAVAALVNKARINAGEPVLSVHALLTEIARSHSKEMVCQGVLSHDSPTAGGATERLESAGYQFSAVGEVIAQGYETPDEVVEAWLASDGHREVLLSDGFIQIGIGLAQSEDEGQTRYWTIVLAAPEKP